MPRLVYVPAILFTLNLAATALSPLDASAGGNERLPNFVIIFTDDQGYQDIGCFGSPKIKTPNLDRMAGEGMKFTDFYSANAVCSASRAALLTGCYPPRVSISGVLFPRHKVGLHPDEITIADLLKQRGYATACIGKWHLGHKPEFLPTRQGFDSYYGIPYSNDMMIDPTMDLADGCVLRQGMTAERIRQEKPKRNWVPLLRGAKVIEYPVDQSTLTKRYTDEAVQFIKTNRSKPFLLYLPHTMPHIPLFASPQFKGSSARGLYGDTIEEIDWSTGQILETIKSLGLDEQTLVIYTSDNGPWKLPNGRGGNAEPLRGYKFQTYEGGMRVPC
ncbi:MAG: sulfatase, partial [Pirellulales bacterium]